MLRVITRQMAYSLMPFEQFCGLKTSESIYSEESVDLPD